LDLLYLNDIAMKAALAAGEVIQKYMNEEVEVDLKTAGSSRASQVVTAVDRACEKVILTHLLPTCREFDLALLSEETEDDASRFEKDYFWCVDPMDGTLPFINKQPGFSVSIALIAKDGIPYIGVVYDPSTDVMYHAIKGMGAFKNGNPWVIEHVNEYLTYVTDRKLKDTSAAIEIERLLQETVESLELNGFVEMAGAGSVLNAIRVLENGPACMLKMPKKENGGGSIWDYAASACIFKELGLPATNLNGGQLDLNRKEDTFMNQEGIFFSNFIGG
jgi:fructose-1,6-bisphosphatase/inositol monophosphatase family enzyme